MQGEKIRFGKLYEMEVHAKINNFSKGHEIHNPFGYLEIQGV